MNKEQAVAIFNSRQMITKAGRYTVKVSNCGDFNKTLTNGTNIVAIANFSAMTAYQLGLAKAQLAEGDIAGALNNNLSLSIRDTDFRPNKGERVNIDVDYVTTKDGAEALLVVAMSPLHVEKAGKVDFSSFLDDAEVEVTTEAEAEATGGLN